MKKFKFNNFAVMLMALASVFLVSCGSDDEEEQKSELSVDVTSIRLDGQAGSTGSLRITSNAAWMVTGVSDWLSLSSTNGNSSAQITITATSSNNSSAERECTLLVSSMDGSQTQSVTIIQSGLLSSGCETTPTNIVAIADGIACDFEYGSNVVYGYAKLYTPSRLERMTDAEIIAEMASDDVENRITPERNIIYVSSGLSSNTDYVICTVGFDANNKSGELVKTPVSTKSSSNQPVARITDVSYDESYWYWTTEPNGFVTKYYQIAFVDEEYLYEPDAYIAWLFDNAMKDDPEGFQPIVQEDNWYRNRNGYTFFHQVTWAVGAEGTFSGVIDRFAAAIDSNRSSRKVMKVNYPESVQKSMMKVYDPTDLKIINIRR